MAAAVVVVVEVFQVEVAVQHTVPADFVESYHRVDLVVMGSQTVLEQSQKLHLQRVSVEDLKYK